MREDEKILLGQVLLKPEILPSLTINDGDFTDPQNKRIFRSINKCVSKGIKPDILTVSDQDKHISPTYISTLTNIISTENWKYYDKKIKNEANRHKLKALGETLINTPISETIDETIEYIQNKIEEITTNTDEFKPETLKQIIPNFINLLEERYKANGALPGLEISLSKLSDVLLGFQKQRLYYIGARPSQGKSALLLNIASDLLKNNKKVGFLSAESGKNEILTRLYAQTININSNNLATGFFNKNTFIKLTEASEKLYTDNMIIYDKPNMSLQDVRIQSKYMCSKWGIDALFIDYIQLITHSGDKKRDQVAEVSVSLKHLSRELDIPVIVAAQLRRDAENRKPNLSDFSDSSQIEKDADGVIMIYHREDASYLCIEKNRDGEIGDIPIYFKREYLKFTEVQR